MDQPSAAAVFDAPTLREWREKYANVETMLSVSTRHFQLPEPK